MTDGGMTQAVVPHHDTSIMDGGEARAVVNNITAVANALKDVIKANRLAVTIQGREYVRVEGWTMIAPLIKVWPKGTPEVHAVINDWCDQHYPRPCGYEASIELAREDGSSAGGGVAECSRHERTWAYRDEYALKSMAQTRAIGKAYRMSFGFVMAAAGYETTPAEEMPRDEDRPVAASPVAARAGTSGAATRPPFWAAPLKAELERRGMELSDLEAVLQERPTTAALNRWFQARATNGGIDRLVQMLVDEARGVPGRAEDGEFVEVTGAADS